MWTAWVWGRVTDRKGRKGVAPSSPALPAGKGPPNPIVQGLASYSIAQRPTPTTLSGTDRGLSTGGPWPARHAHPNRGCLRASPRRTSNLGPLHAGLPPGTSLRLASPRRTPARDLPVPGLPTPESTRQTPVPDLPTPRLPTLNLPNQNSPPRTSRNQTFPRPAPADRQAAPSDPPASPSLPP